MGKIFKLVMFSLMLIAAFAISGCGGDKFAGDWVTTQKNMAFKFGGDYYKQLKIEKNGDSYIIKEIISSYDLKKTKNGGKGFNVTYDGNFVWEKDKERQIAAKPQGDNQLVVNGAFGAIAITYVEKEGTLLIGKEVYTKEKSDSMNEFKKAEQARLQKMYDDNDMGFYTQKTLTSLKFSDGDNKK